MTESSFDEEWVGEALGETGRARVKDELALLETAGNAFDPEVFLRGEVTPVFFGSAMNNFGVEPFLDRFSELAPPPRAAHDVGRHRWRPTIRASRASCSRSRRTWIPSTGIGWRSCASVRDGSGAACRCTHVRTGKS